VIELGPNRYGKSAIRLVKVVRGPDGNRIRDLTVAVALEGDFAAAHTHGDNAKVVATDTMKNTVYAFAQEHLSGPVEAFATVLARHFAAIAQVERATVSIREHRWAPIPTDGGPSLDAFLRLGDFTRTACVTASAGGSLEMDAGVEDLTVMKTARSAFRGFPRDTLTTLSETDDRIMATKVTATWSYGPTDLDWDAVHDGVLGTMLDVLAEHASLSVQHSIWVVARAMLERHAALDEVRMVLPNLHHWMVDLSPFGMDNPGAIFIATTEPHGLIEATVRRSADR
jgi:urate oxidase